MVKLITNWLGNFRTYEQVGDQRADRNDWKSYMDNNILHQQYACLGRGSAILRYRGVMVAIALINIIPLFMLASTYNIFYPELEWKCIVEPHTGMTTICAIHDYNTIQRKSSVCAMEHGIDFQWNFTFTNSPILEFDEFCPLERSVEPKLVNILGSFCGSLIGGIFIDTLGRKNMALISLFFSMLCTLSYYICSTIIMYTYQEFIKGLFSSIAAMSLLTWTVELSKSEYSSLTVSSFFLFSGIGQLLTIGITYLTKQWRIVIIIISGIGLGLIPILFLVPMSLRYLIAKGKTKLLPMNINYKEGYITGARAKDCLARPQTNKLYAANALLLIFLGFSSHLLTEVIFLKYQSSNIFERQTIQVTMMVIGYAMAAMFSLLPLLVYLINVFMVLIAGILAIVATSTNYSDSPWSLSRVFTGGCLMLVTVAVSITFTTVKQVPTLNRGFYVSSLNASYMLGGLLCTIVQSWCLERENDSKYFCSERSEDARLRTVGVVLLASVGLAFVNTCLTKNVALPHSYDDLISLNERRTSTDNIPLQSPEFQSESGRNILQMS